MPGARKDFREGVHEMTTDAGVGIYPNAALHQEKLEEISGAKDEMMSPMLSHTTPNKSDT